MPFGAAHALGVVTYVGHAAADNFNPLNRLNDIDHGTTFAPASYGVNVDGNVATSITDSAQGGSAYAYSLSVAAYSPVLGFTVGGGAGATTTIHYQVMLSGPAAATVVPVHVLAHGLVDGEGSTQASASFSVNYDSGGAGAILLAGINLNGVSGNSFSFDQVTNFKVNAVFDVYLRADSGSGGPGGPAGWSKAFVDPSFTIDDPALAALYHFEGIPSAVPESATWALTMLGLGVVLGVRRRRTALVPVPESQ
ncbi:hypothetical protein ASC91_14305 [Pelomonas sp. Root1237]|nr:hypothetical protein ASC91_14305 [Pelomonas sp. Root1237]